MQPFHTRDDRGYISLLIYRQWSPVATNTIVLELSSQDEHQAFSDPENQKLLFKTRATSSFSLAAHAGTLAHIRLFLNDDDLLTVTEWNVNVVEAREPDSEISAPETSISQRPSSEPASPSLCSVNVERLPPWREILQQFEIDQARRQVADRVSFVGVSNPSSDSPLRFNDDHESYAIRHEDEMRSQRSSHSRQSSIAQAGSRNWALSLQGLDLEYNRHDAETRSVASTRSISR